MHDSYTRPRLLAVLVATSLVALVAVFAAGAASAAKPDPRPKPVFTDATAFDVSQPLRVLAQDRVQPGAREEDDDGDNAIADSGFTGDLGSVQSQLGAAAIAAPLTSFD